MARSPFRHRGRRLRRAVASVARYGAARGLGADPSAAAERMGERLVHELDHMKGMAMKVGQILSYMHGAVPESTQVALAALQEGVRPALEPEEVVRLVEEVLQAPLAERFEHFDLIPVAAASIGQVHRARIDGAEVAVKLRYPGVVEAFEADLRTMRRMARVAGLVTAVDARAIVDDVRAHLIEECDYGLEAARQRAFAWRWRGDADVRISQVVDSHSGPGLLTTAWLDGTDVTSFAASSASRAARERAGVALLRFTWTSLFVQRAVHADPHPGNLRVDADGSLGVLDFGCVRSFDDRFVDTLAAEVRALMAEDRQAFRRAVRDSGIVPVEAGFDWDRHWSMQRHAWRPYLTERFSFDEAWLAEGQEHFGPANPNLRRLAIPPEWTWLARVQYGVHAALVRLGVRLPARAVLESVLDAPPDRLDLASCPAPTAPTKPNASASS